MNSKIIVFFILASVYIISAAQENTTTSTERNTFGSETGGIEEKANEYTEKLKDAENTMLSETVKAIKESIKTGQETSQQMLKTGEQFANTKLFSRNIGNKK